MKHILLMSLLMLGAMVNAQNSNEDSYIEVNGQSERFVTPDEIYLQVILVADKASAFKELESKTMEALERLGVNSDDITLADAQGNEVSSWFRDGFESQRLLLVKVSSAEMVGKVMEGLHAIGVKKIAIAKVDYSQKEELMNELRVEAMKNAKMKSVLMLEAIGSKLGAPLSVRENSWGTRPVHDNIMLRGAMSQEMLMSPSSENQVISFKKLQYKSEVSVRFGIVN